jgi:arylsulfatase
VGLAALAAWLAAGCAEPASRRPSVLLVTIDTLRADHLHGYGFPLAVSPRLDALAAQGVLFERAIAASSATAPSHASILTSRYPRQHTVGYGNGSTRLERDPTLAESFARAGYRTAAFVGNLVLERRTGFDRGFEHYDDDFDRREPNRESYERIAEHTTQRALAWIESVGDAPWFVWIHYQDPHGPYAPPAEHVGRFRVEAPADEPALPDAEEGTDRGGIPAYQKLDGLTRLSQYRGRYADEIFYADLWIGRLLDAVDAREPAPIVLVTADHGESMGENGRYFVHFWTTTPENAHVPMILRAPGLAPGRSSRVVSHVDVMPTLLELAGLPIPASSRGLALGPALRAGRPLPDRVVFSDTGHELTAYRSRWFVRILLRAPGEDPSSAAAREPRTIGYAWRNDGEWTAMRRDVELADQERAYLALEPRTTPAPLLDADTARRLRQLGYAPER